VHHADGDETNDAIENLVPLCPSCHQKVHNRTLENRQLVKLANRLECAKPALAPEDYPEVPDRATITVKETYPGYKYYYWQWRDGAKIKSAYIGPTDDYDFSASPDPHEQATFEQWSKP
jgi:hypothetical protein